MKYGNESQRLAAFYRTYEIHRFVRVGVTGKYSTREAIDWGIDRDLQPVPGPKAHPDEIEAWERRLEAVVARGVVA